MSDYSEHGALPVDDAAVPDPPTVDDVLTEGDAEDRREGDPTGDEDDEPDEPPA